MFYRMTISAAAILLLVCGSLPAAAETPLDKISEIRSDAASGTATDMSDEIDKLARFRARMRRELEIGKLLDDALDEWSAGRDVSTTGPLEKAVKEQFAMLEALATEAQGRVQGLQKKAREAELSERLELEYRLRDYDSLLSDLYTEGVANAARAETLELGVTKQLGALDERLQTRAARLGERLTETLPRIDTVTEQIKGASDSAKAELEADLVVLEERRRRLKAALGVTIDLMQKRELDASEYVELLFRATGVISTDLFDANVLRSLAGEWLDNIRTTVVRDGPGWVFRGIVFVLVVVIARWLGKLASRLVSRALAAATVPMSNLMQAFFVKLTANLVFLFGLLIALSQVGVNLGPVLAGLGIAGFIVGFALQDTLSNFASGMMILFYRPYDVGDVVEAGGVNGKVQKMSLVSTTIVTFDNQKLVVPNNKIWGDVIRNVNAEANRRVDMTFGISYDDDIAEAEALLKEIVGAHELVLDDPEPTIKLHTLGESSVDFIVRPWVRAADYWAVYWDLTRTVKQRFDEADITIPYPQRDVHVFETTAK